MELLLASDDDERTRANFWLRGREAFERTPLLVLLAALIALHVALHIRWLNLPPGGLHLWRQTQTLSVARNFYDEGFDPLRPRVDSRGASSGITGMECPLVNAAIAGGYRMFGFHHGLHRVVMLCLSLPAILGMMMLAGMLLGSKASGFVAGALLVTNPLFAYYSVSALPEVPMLSALLLGLAGLVSWSRSLRPGPLMGGVSALSLAGLVKLSSAAAWPAALLLLSDGLRRATIRERVLALGTSAAGLALVAAWYLWARHLSDASGNRAFLTGAMFPYPIRIVPAVLRNVFMHWLPEVYVSYPQFVLVLVGLGVLTGRAHASMVRVLAAWGLGIVAYGAAMLPHLAKHDYYMAPATPMLLLIATLGFERVCAAAETKRAMAMIAALLLVLTAVIGPARGLSRLVRVKRGGDFAAIETDLRKLLPRRDALVIAASDPSPSIDLYFMHRKGWAVTDRVPAKRFEAMIRDGARCLVSDSRALEARPDVARHLRLLGTSGRFRVFDLVETAT